MYFCFFVLGKLIDGLVANNLHHYSHLLTGYVGSASFLDEIVKLIPILKEKNPKLCFCKVFLFLFLFNLLTRICWWFYFLWCPVCDPVMGDNGKLYVPKELVEIYKNKIVPLADILTPNQFELE